jgi:hypothetical protein
MKKLIAGLTIAILSCAFIPARSETVPAVVSTTHPSESAAANVLIHRLNEINAMDKSTLIAPEKKALRKEVRSIKKELNVNGGVYLSVGALLLIIILLIVLI